MNSKLLAAFLPAYLMAAAAVSAQDPLTVAGSSSLKVGSAAPALKVDKWIKGEPVKDVKKGVHVVEFWATWCGPCIQTIPHLTEVAKKFKGKATVTGVSVYEDTSEAAWQDGVVKFVKDMGDKMDYHVAVDNADGWMGTNWMEAAGQDGIPTAFVVKDGVILWIGHPTELEPVLSDVVTGKFDLAAAKKKAAEDEKKQAEMMKLSAQLDEAMQNGDTNAALKIIDQFIAIEPAMGESLASFKFELLASSSPDKALAYAKQVLEKDFKDNARVLNDIAWSLVDPDSEIMKRDDKLALKMAQRAVELTKSKDAFILDTLAMAYWRNGKKEDAIKTQEKAINIAKNPSDETPPVPEEILAEMEARLAEFKKG